MILVFWIVCICIPNNNSLMVYCIGMTRAVEIFRGFAWYSMGNLTYILLVCVVDDYYCFKQQPFSFLSFLFLRGRPLFLFNTTMNEFKI